MLIAALEGITYELSLRIYLRFLSGLTVRSGSSAFLARTGSDELARLHRGEQVRVELRDLPLLSLRQLHTVIPGALVLLLQRSRLQQRLLVHGGALPAVSLDQGVEVGAALSLRKAEVLLVHLPQLLLQTLRLVPPAHTRWHHWRPIRRGSGGSHGEDLGSVGCLGRLVGGDVLLRGKSPLAHHDLVRRGGGHLLGPS